MLSCESASGLIGLLVRRASKHMNIINHILSLPWDQSTFDFALICAAMIAARVMLSVVFHKLTK